MIALLRAVAFGRFLSSAERPLRARERPQQPPSRELWPAADLAVLREQLTEEPDGLQLLRWAAATGAPAVAVCVLAFELIFGRPAKLSHQRLEQLDRLAAKADRVGRLGTGKVGAGAIWMIDRMQDHAADAEAFEPNSLGWFVVALRREVRRWSTALAGRPSQAGRLESREDWWERCAEYWAGRRPWEQRRFRRSEW